MFKLFLPVLKKKRDYCLKLSGSVLKIEFQFVLYSSNLSWPSETWRKQRDFSLKASHSCLNWSECSAAQELVGWNSAETQAKRVESRKASFTKCAIAETRPSMAAAADLAAPWRQILGQSLRSSEPNSWTQCEQQIWNNCLSWWYWT